MTLQKVTVSVCRGVPQEVFAESPALALLGQEQVPWLL
jgi:hypothetical protein